MNRQIRAAALSVLCGLFLAGCSAPEDVGTGPVSQIPGQNPAPSETVVKACRIVADADEGFPLLAELDGDANGVYRLSTEKLPIEAANEADKALRDGMVIEVTFDGTVMETYPAQFSGVQSLKVRENAMDDRCALYLGALNDLWEKDAGLNSDIQQIGLDLSETSLSSAEQAAVAWAFGEQHDLPVVRGTLQELRDQGYLEAEGDRITQWKDGCWFSIQEEGEKNQAEVRFDVEKWRTALGAYVLMDCTSARGADGRWSAYTVGSEAIA